MARIIDESSQSTLSSSDVFLIDNSSTGTHKISASDIGDGILINFCKDSENVAALHNSIFRGKNLGSSLTTEQSTAISNGTFDDIWVGDYWLINNVKYRVAECDGFYRCGDNVSLGHHVVVVPDSSLYSAQMQNTETGGYIAGSEYNYTTGGYVESDMRTTNLARATTMVETAFGESHILSYRDLLTNRVASGQANGWAWTDCRVELMSEQMVWGNTIWGKSGYEGGCHPYQFALFRLAPELIHRRYNYWLRSVAGAAYFAFVYGYGSANNLSASYALGVRPAFLVH